MPKNLHRFFNSRCCFHSHFIISRYSSPSPQKTCLRFLLTKNTCCAKKRKKNEKFQSSPPGIKLSVPNMQYIADLHPKELLSVVVLQWK